MKKARISQMSVHGYTQSTMRLAWIVNTARLECHERHVDLGSSHSLTKTQVSGQEVVQGMEQGGELQGSRGLASLLWSRSQFIADKEALGAGSTILREHADSRPENALPQL